jgi:CMP/dCMP kinase
LKKLVIAIDGPAASGKSTTSRLVAERLGYLHIDTGAMYRAMTLKVLQKKIDLEDAEQIGKLAENSAIRLVQDHGKFKVFIDNEDVTQRIRNQDVTRAVSAVSSIPRVREVMVREQRLMAKKGGVVLEGRDIGTVVFPNADVKFFMVADVKERARRRKRELEGQGVEVEMGELVHEIQERDQKDSKRIVSPLRKAQDAVVLDTSHLTIDEQVELIVKKSEEVLGVRA